MTNQTSEPEPFVTIQLDPVKLAAVYRPALVDRWVTLTVTPPGGAPHELTGWVVDVTDVGAGTRPVGPYLLVHFDIPDEDGRTMAVVVQGVDAVARVYDDTIVNYVASPDAFTVGTGVLVRVPNAGREWVTVQARVLSQVVDADATGLACYAMRIVGGSSDWIPADIAARARAYGPPSGAGR